MAAVKGKNESIIYNKFMQRLSVILMNGNAALLINQIPDFPGPEFDGEM